MTNGADCVRSLGNNAVVSLLSGDDSRHSGGRVRDPSRGRRSVGQANVGHGLDVEFQRLAVTEKARGVERRYTASVAEKENNVLGLLAAKRNA